MAGLRNILLVDDDQDDRYLFSEALSSLGKNINLYEASSAHDALYQLNNNAPLPEAIFLDLNMPKQNGYEFLSTMKSASNVIDIPVIIYSTSNTEEDKRKTLELGAIHFMTKHNSFSELCSELYHVLFHKVLLQA